MRYSEEVQGEAVLAVLESGTDDEVLEDVEHEEAVLDGDLLEDVELESAVRDAVLEEAVLVGEGLEDAVDGENESA